MQKDMDGNNEEEEKTNSSIRKLFTTSCNVLKVSLDWIYIVAARRFLTGFIANSERRGRDPTVEKVDRVHINHAKTTWAELRDGLLCYRPCLTGRHIRVAQVQDQGGIFRGKRMVMKSTWEEKLPPESSPPSEVEVLTILEANVRGLPQPYALESAIVRDDGNLEVETRSFPENGEVAFPVSTTNLMAKM